MHKPVELRPVNLQWITDDDAGTDLCAHGGVEVWVDGQLALDDSDENWTLSAAALNLLRSLDPNFPMRDRVGQQLFPCCADAFFVDDEGEFFSIGCEAALEGSVELENDRVHVRLRDSAFTVGQADWAAAVLNFSLSVRAFYDSQPPRTPSPDDLPGWRAFLDEWRRREDDARRRAACD